MKRNRDNRWTVRLMAANLLVSVVRLIYCVIF